VRARVLGGIVTVLVLVAIAAALQPGRMAPGDGGDETPQVALAPEGPAPGRMVWSGCVAWRVVAQAPGPAAPSVRPAGWEAADTPLTVVTAEGFRCQRIALGELERGPVHLVVETHNDARFPAGCRAEPAGSASAPGLRVLGTFWIDDAGLAAELNQSYGLPARFAAFDVSDTGTAVAQQDWAWAEAGRTASRITLAADTALPTGGPSPQRLLWARDDGLASLDLSVEGTGSPLHRPAAGRFQPPMLMSAVAEGAFAGSGEWLSAAEATADFTLYGDQDCGRLA
jgi:hypothetical protein